MTSTEKLQYLKIGLSLPGATAEDLQIFHDIPECFEILELPGELVNDAHKLIQENNLLQEFEVLNFRNLLPANLTTQLTTADTAIVQEYKKQLRELFARAHHCHAEHISIDPDWEALYQDEQRMKILDDVLRSTAGDRKYYDLTLALTVRFPGSGQVQLPESVKLLRQLANYRVKLALDINPHELLNSSVDWAALLRHFRFDTVCIRFCYLSELGNKLLYKHIEPVIKAVSSWQQEVNIYIAPSGRADLNELAETVKAITNESTQK